MSIRQLEQYSLYTRLALANCKGLYVDPISIAFIVYVKMFDSAFFDRYSKKQISHNDVIKHFEENYNYFLSTKNNAPTYLFYNAVADMLAIRCGYDNLDELYVIPMKDLGQENIKLKLRVSKFNAEQLSRCFMGKSSQMVGFETLLSKINLDNDFIA